MENQKRDYVLDRFMTRLLALGYCFDVGIPSWLLKELVTRKFYPVEPQDVLGLSKEFKENSIVAEYMSMKGYEFSWGTLSEEIYQDEEDGTCVARFEIFPKEVLMIFPQSAMVEDLFIWMYQNHPMRSREFSGDESCGDWFVLSFEATGEKNISELRRWLARVFIPKIMPDLIFEAMRIVTNKKIMDAVDRCGDGPLEDSYYEKGRFWLCGDPADLSFNSPGYTKQ